MLCERTEAFVRALSAAPATVIHGEYVPHNVLIRRDDAYPIDWESAAIAFGEIDLASLVDKWPPDVEQACEREYQRARWPSGPPPNFLQTLDMARLYWDFRWLGDRPEWTGSEKVGPRFEHLRRTAERLGLVDKARIQ
jgi:aminoglycoside phosphotransferase (APT) family kinase protein